MKELPRVKILVSNEPDDDVGRELLGRIEGVEVLPYDPNSSQLADEQRAADVLIPPYRGSHRPIPLLGQLPDLRMVQLLSAAPTSGPVMCRPMSRLPVPAVHTPDRCRNGCSRRSSPSCASGRHWCDIRTQGPGRTARSTPTPSRVNGSSSSGQAASAPRPPRLLAAFGATATLVASTARGDVHAASELPGLVGGHDIVVITAPLNEGTRGLVDEGFLAAIDDGAMLVNAGRGQIVDTDALIAELRAGRLRAALDVTDPEPLPADHPLWTSPGVIISPHSARTVPGTNALCYTVAAQQIMSFIEGGVPSSVVKSRTSKP
jgi:phosphoglycerate dehydrogenase-like enzyme